MANITQLGTQPATTSAPQLLSGRKAWLWRWTKLAGLVVFAQLFCQLLNGLTGFMLVRALPKEQYAWFTICAAMATVLSALSDGGVGTATLFIGGRVWQDRLQLSAVIQASLSMLNQLAVVGLVLVMPAMIWLLIRMEVPAHYIALLCLLTLAPQWMLTRTTILSSINRLHSKVGNLQLSELCLASLRFVLTMGPWLFGLIHVVWASAALAVSIFMQSWLVRRQIRPLIDPVTDSSSVATYQPEIRKTVRQMYPNAVFNCVQSQLSMWLLAALGTSASVADFGALGRLAFITNLAAAPLSILVAPAFARSQDANRLRIQFLGIFVCYAFFFLSLVAACLLFPKWILLVFGDKYAHLEYELALFAIGLMFGGLNSVCWTLNLSRGWVKYVWLVMPLTLVTQAASVLMVDVRSVSGAAWLGINLAAAYLLHSLAISAWGLRTSPNTLKTPEAT